MDNYLKVKKEEIISTHGIRFSPKQKKRFLSYMQDDLKKLGWKSEVIKGNLVVGDIKNADIIFTAHYDTPGIMPIWMRWLMKLLGHDRQITMVLLLFLLIIPLVYLELWLILTLFYMSLIGILIPNKNNYNDNSSGALTLINISYNAATKDEYKDKKDKIALIFFNNEEWGLLGSSYMRKYFKKNNISLDSKKIINFDCVGNGDMIQVTHGKGIKLAEQLEELLSSSGDKEIAKYKYKLIPLSDDYTFKDHEAVSIVFCNKTIISGGHYIPYIHSSKDRLLELSNVIWLTKELLSKFMTSEGYN